MLLESLFSWGWVPIVMFIHTNLSPWLQQSGPAGNTWSQASQSISLSLAATTGFKNTSFCWLLKLKTCNLMNCGTSIFHHDHRKRHTRGREKRSRREGRGRKPVRLRVYPDIPHPVTLYTLTWICSSAFCCLCCHHWHFCSFFPVSRKPSEGGSDCVWSVITQYEVTIRYSYKSRDAWQHDLPFTWP